MLYTSSSSTQGVACSTHNVKDDIDLAITHGFVSRGSTTNICRDSPRLAASQGELQTRCTYACRGGTYFQWRQKRQGRAHCTHESGTQAYSLYSHPLTRLASSLLIKRSKWHSQIYASMGKATKHLIRMNKVRFVRIVFLASFILFQT
jgi:hypothetical protein